MRAPLQFLRHRLAQRALALSDAPSLVFPSSVRRDSALYRSARRAYGGREAFFRHLLDDPDRDEG